MKILLSSLVVLAVLQGCASQAPVLSTLSPSPDFAPVYPLAKDQTAPATGGIYGNRQSDAWFGRPLGGCFGKASLQTPRGRA